MIMKRLNQKLSETDREEDYRDYEARDLDEGWPYADEDATGGKTGTPYGKSTSNFDESERVGAEISDETVIHSQGGPDASPSGEDSVIEDDVLEDTVNSIFENHERIDTSLITVTVHDGVVTMEGSAETEGLRMLAERTALSVKGVRGCRNRLTLIGADSHIPADADE
jgi:hypothetical protein